MTELLAIFIGTLVVSAPAMWLGWNLPEWIKIIRNKWAS